jgi:hypothetical protein
LGEIILKKNVRGFFMIDADKIPTEKVTIELIDKNVK